MCSSLLINYTAIKLPSLNVIASSQERLDLPTSLKQLEESANYIRQWLWHTGQDSLQHRRGTWERRNKGSGPGIAPDHWLESFQASEQTDRSRTKPVVSLGWEGRVCSSERQVTRTDGKEKKRRERHTDLQSLPSKASAQFCPRACRWRNAEAYWEEERGTTPGAYPGLRRTHISTGLQGRAT